MEKRVATVDALRALERMSGSNEDRTTLAQFLAEAHCSPMRAPPENTGLPCEYCGEPQRKLVIDRDRETDTLTIRIAMRGSDKDIKGLIKLLRGFAS